MVGVDSDSFQADSQPKVVWLTLRVGSRLAPSVLHWSNEPGEQNSRRGSAMMTAHENWHGIINLLLLLLLFLYSSVLSLSQFDLTLCHVRISRTLRAELRRTSEWSLPSLAGHVMCWRPSIYVSLGCGWCCRTVLVDKSLASIEAEDRWRKRVPAAASPLFESRRSVVFGSRSLLTTAPWPPTSSTLYHGHFAPPSHPVVVVIRCRVDIPSGRRFVPSFPQFIWRRSRPSPSVFAAYDVQLIFVALSCGQFMC